MIGERRMLVRVTVQQSGLGDWTARIIYLDDQTEDRRIGFTSQAEARGWVEARIERHFRFGVPGRIG